ncbi:cache domain-containing sensor histidine kinase [Paenibacillus swuensis]|uniref:cache domain-containing sensor histidine kinase n=1 Tax=Paenibacillus swuensis TaxID=1178515 RepID=UPI000AD9C5CB|nr:sensor histidine kinase [Paenibacillus swuensis]
MRLSFIEGSIRSKLILFLLIAIIVPMTASIVISYFYTQDQVIEESVRSNTNLMFQGSTNLTNYMNIVEQSSLTPYTDTRTGTNTLFKIMERGLTDYMSKAEIYSSLINTSRAVKEIHQVYLYIQESKDAYLLNNGNKKEGIGTEPYRSLPDAPYRAYVEPTHLSHDYGLPKQSPYYAPQTVISIHRPIYKVPTAERIGQLSIDVKLDVIRSISEQLYTRGKEDLYILDHEGYVIYAGDEKWTGKHLNDEWAKDLLSREADSGHYNSSDEIFKGMNVYQHIRTPYLQWTIVKRIPDTTLYESVRQMTEINVIVMSASILIIVLGALYISVLFTQPIKQLIRSITQIGAGRLDVDIDVRRSDEIGILARRFQGMMQTINNLIMKEYKLEIANKTNQLKALQAQINPHFMNNALQSIGTLALQHNEKKIYTLISSLGKMMRYNMNTNEALVPLSKEMEHAKAYLELQGQRFEDKLTAKFYVEPEASAIVVPKMLLQPIIENYFKHGYETQGGEGTIDIDCRVVHTDPIHAANDEQHVEQLLRIEIRNNGRSIDEDDLLELQARLDLPPGSVTDLGYEGVGLLNVLSRLKLYFNDNATMTIENVQPVGLTVVMMIPTTKGVERVESINR